MSYYEAVYWPVTVADFVSQYIVPENIAINDDSVDSFLIPLI